MYEPAQVWTSVRVSFSPSDTAKGTVWGEDRFDIQKGDNLPRWRDCAVSPFQIFSTLNVGYFQSERGHEHVVRRNILHLPREAREFGDGIKRYLPYRGKSHYQREAHPRRVGYGD